MEDNLIENLDPELGRGMVINWENVLIRIISDYEEHTTITHGVQKDAVQNAWDARKDRRKAKNWSVSFELLSVGDNDHLFIINDKGTTGLTGEVLQPSELERDLPPDQRWGRFENMAFTKDPSEESLGARGQGKFIFVAASKNRSIVYDTLLDDGVYRLGLLRIKGKTDCRTWSWEGDEALKMLEQVSPKLEPLHEVGTRVIIINPIDELLTSVQNGQFIRMIGETWWEIIDKYYVSMSLIFDGNEYTAEVPALMKLAESKSNTNRVRVKENETITASRKRYRIKRFVVVYVPNKVVSQDIRGIAVQRGGMKITSETYRYGPREPEAHIFGYIQFDKKLDLAMAKEESSTHYSFSWRKSVPRAVRQFIDRELSQFYREIGYGPDPVATKHRKRSEAERIALMAANKVAKSLGVLGGGVGGVGSGGGGGGDPTKLIYLSMPELELPTETLRVEFGDSVSGIIAKVNNRTDNGILALLKIYITLGDQIVHNFLEEEISVPLINSSQFGPFSIKLLKKKFPASGRYTVRARLISLMSTPTLGMERKGKEVDKIAKVFYLNQDPPIGGLFEKVIPVEWDDDSKKSLLGRQYIGERKGYIYEYNVLHRGYEVLENDEADISEYIYKLLVQAVVEIDLEADPPSLFKEDDLAPPNNIAKRMGKLMGEALHNFYE